MHGFWLHWPAGDSLLHSMAENKTKHWYPGYSILGTRVQNAINYLFTFFIDSCSKIGEEQSSEDAEDGPPELLVSSTSHALVTVHLIQLG